MNFYIQTGDCKFKKKTTVLEKKTKQINMPTNVSYPSSELCLTANIHLLSQTNSSKSCDSFLLAPNSTTMCLLTLQNDTYGWKSSGLLHSQTPAALQSGE